MKNYTPIKSRCELRVSETAEKLVYFGDIHALIRVRIARRRVGGSMCAPYVCFSSG